MNKRKLMLVAVALCMAAILLAGGTLAYLTDTDAKTNTFTVGNVQIEIEENFTQDSKLLPGIDVTKEVKIKNIGTEDAYVWYTYAIPSVLNNDTDASKNILHVNHYGRTWDTYRNVAKYWAEGQTEALPLEQTWDVDWKLVGNNVTIDDTGIEYDVYVCLYHGILAPGAETTYAMSKVYLDTKVDFDGTYYTYDGVKIDFDMINDIKIVINAYAIQAAGIPEEEKEGQDGVYTAYELFQAQFAD